MNPKPGPQWMTSPALSGKTSITRVFNFGTWEEWQDMKKRFSRKDIEEAVKNPLRGQWTPRARALAELMFECRMPDVVLISYEA